MSTRATPGRRVIPLGGSHQRLPRLDESGPHQVRLRVEPSVRTDVCPGCRVVLGHRDRRRRHRTRIGNLSRFGSATHLWDVLTGSSGVRSALPNHPVVERGVLLVALAQLRGRRPLSGFAETQTICAPRTARTVRVLKRLAASASIDPGSRGRRHERWTSRADST